MSSSRSRWTAVRRLIAFGWVAGNVTLFSSVGCDLGCEEETCDGWGGSADKTFQSCYVSGDGSSSDEFWLEDEEGTEFFRCERAADDNDACGVELISAKEAFCASGSGTGGGGTISTTSGTGAAGGSDAGS